MQRDERRHHDDDCLQDLHRQREHVLDGEGEKRRVTRDIPLGARIIAVADVYDALSSDRPYRKAMSPFDAREAIVRGSETQFDPVVVNAFLKAFGEGALEIPEIVV